MKLANLVGTMLIVVAVLFGVLGALGLYRWEATSRAATLALLYTPTPLPPHPTSTPQPGTNPPTQSSPAAPLASPGAVNAEAGARLFASNCNACHPQANAGVGPALHGPEFAAKYPDDAALRAVIRSGRDGMPAFNTSALPDADLDGIIAYLRSLK